ncbi:MAG: hypothetical protein DFNUSKGM_000173, partial [Candidatus Fervidibacter sacchari]
SLSDQWQVGLNTERLCAVYIFVVQVHIPVAESSALQVTMQ